MLVLTVSLSEKCENLRAVAIRLLLQYYIITPLLMTYNGLSMNYVDRKGRGKGKGDGCLNFFRPSCHFSRSRSTLTDILVTILRTVINVHNSLINSISCVWLRVILNCTRFALATRQSFSFRWNAVSLKTVHVLC